MIGRLMILLSCMEKQCALFLLYYYGALSTIKRVEKRFYSNDHPVLKDGWAHTPQCWVNRWMSYHLINIVFYNIAEIKENHCLDVL